MSGPITKGTPLDHGRYLYFQSIYRPRERVREPSCSTSWQEISLRVGHRYRESIGHRSLMTNLLVATATLISKPRYPNERDMNMGPVDDAIRALKNGEIVLIFDSEGRERETDMVIASEHVTYESIRTLRKEAGGLICTTVPSSTWEKIDLPFLAEVLGEASKAHPLLALLAPDDLPYDTKSAFSLTINHRRTVHWHSGR